MEPNNFDARLKRALVLRRLGKAKEALADLDLLVADERTPTRVYFVRASVRTDLGEKAGAAADRTEGLKRVPLDPASFVTRGLALASKEPERALTDFQAAETLDPNYPEALLNQAWILAEKLDRTSDALKAVDRLLALYPDHQNGRGGRAVYLARLGRGDEAVAKARKLLDATPQASAYYQAACVFALVAKTSPKLKAEGVRLLASSLRHGFGFDYLLADPDLESLQDEKDFRVLAEAVRVMNRNEKR